MVTQAMRKAQAKGLTVKQLEQITIQRGLYGLSDVIGCGIDSARTCAREDLGIADPPLWTANDARSNEAIRHDIVREMFAAYCELQKLYDEALAELQNYRHAERNREQIEKNEYIHMLTEIKKSRREIKERKPFNAMDICKEQVDFA